MTAAVHRIIEQRAAATPDAAAIVDGGQVMTYRELNLRANALARRLGECGLTRGALAHVRMPRSADLAVTLLAALKAGASYAWLEPGSREQDVLPASFCIRQRGTGGEEKFLAIDIEPVLAVCAARPSPNLPVLTRGSDVACVIPDGRGRPHVLVPHATIAALPHASSPWRAWEGSAGALDMWMGLMSGATLTLGAVPPATAAA